MITNYFNADVLKVNPSRLCKEKVAKAFKNMPKNYLEILIHHYPEYNTIAGGYLISNVRACRTADQRLTDIFVDIANGKLTL